jgi:hypothetical protein
MAISSEVSTVFKGSANQAPAVSAGKYWADDLTWKDLPAVSKFPLVCDTVDALETLTIPSTYQCILEGTLHNNGIIDNSGKVVIL